MSSPFPLPPISRPTLSSLLPISRPRLDGALLACSRLPVNPVGRMLAATCWRSHARNEITNGLSIQTGIVGSRIIVHESIHDEFVAEFKSVVQQIEVGKDTKAFYGSLISKVQFDKVMNYIEIGKKEAKLELGGARHGDKGYFVQPTVFSGVDNKHKIAQEEIFGPVASIIKFKDEEDAVKIANDTI